MNSSAFSNANVRPAVSDVNGIVGYIYNGKSRMVVAQSEVQCGMIIWLGSGKDE